LLRTRKKTKYKTNIISRNEPTTILFRNIVLNDMQFEFLRWRLIVFYYFSEVITLWLSARHGLLTI